MAPASGQPVSTLTGGPRGEAAQGRECPGHPGLGPAGDSTCPSHSSNTQAPSQVTTSWPHPCSLLWSPRPRVTLFGAQNILEQ